MTKPISSFAPRLIAAALLLLAAGLLPPAAAAVECACPSSATASVWGELKQLTCSNLESNLYSNLRSYANAQCGACGACFYDYWTDHPACTIIGGFYTQSGTLTYACGFYVGPPCPECV